MEAARAKVQAEIAVPFELPDPPPISSLSDPTIPSEDKPSSHQGDLSAVSAISFVESLVILFMVTLCM
jgi:hypothetical protein